MTDIAEHHQEVIRAEQALHGARNVVRDLVARQKIERAAVAGALRDFNGLFPRLSTAQLKRDTFAANNAKAIEDIESGYVRPPERRAATAIDQSSGKDVSAAGFIRKQMVNGFRRPPMFMPPAVKSGQ